jgi:hypothetical protein
VCSIVKAEKRVLLKRPRGTPRKLFAGSLLRVLYEGSAHEKKGFCQENPVSSYLQCEIQICDLKLSSSIHATTLI